MIKIDKKTRNYLVANGVVIGEEGIKSVHKQHGKTHYYLTESIPNMIKLEEYNKKVIVNK